MKWEKRLIIGLFSLLIAFFAVFKLKEIGERKKKNELREIPVTIEGIVRKPGVYYVPYGTTKFEVLRVAGVLPNSDLADVDIYAQAESGEQINVGKLEQDVTIKPDEVAKACQINYAIGDVTIKGSKGVKKAEKDISVIEGDVIVTGKNGSIELRLGDESLVDLRSESELLVESLYKASGDGQLAVNFSLTKGRLWSFIKPQPANIRWKFFTQYLVADIQGTEIEINHSLERSVLLVKKGLVYAGRKNTEKRLSVMEGQKIVVESDMQKDIAVSEQTDEDRISAIEDSALARSQGAARTESVMRRFVFLLVPHYYVLTEINQQNGAITVNRIMPSINVSDYVEGVNDLGKVYLYGGIRLTVSVIERITRKRIEKFAVLDQQGMTRTIDKLGGVTLDLDFESAEALGLKQGRHKLSSERVISYVKGSNRSSFASSFDRQENVIKALFNEVIQSKVLLTNVLITQLTQGLETDIDPSYGVELYDLIKTRNDWRVDIVQF
jgi:hypothetical protein